MTFDSHNMSILTWNLFSVLFYMRFSADRENQYETIEEEIYPNMCNCTTVFLYNSVKLIECDSQKAHNGFDKKSAGPLQFNLFLSEPYSGNLTMLAL